MLSQLLNRPVTIAHSPDPDGDETLDEYGNANPAADPDMTTIETVGELQQRQRSEPGDQGETSDTLWLLVLPADTTISTADTVTVDGVAYEVVGDPWPARNPLTQAESHVECTVRRTA